MKLIIDIPRKTYEEISAAHSIHCGEDFAQKLIRSIKSGISIMDNATNLDVLLAVFPNMEKESEALFSKYGTEVLYNASELWLKQPYKFE